MKTALLLTAHADDAEFFAGGQVCLLIEKGWSVHEVIFTDNGKGSFELGSSALVAQSRDREARAVAEFLGKASVDFLGYPDGELAGVSALELREHAMRAIRRLRPDLVLSFDPWAPFEPHPDHRAVAFAATEAVAFGALPLFHPEHRTQGLEPHRVPECLFFGKSDERANLRVDISSVIDRKVDALCLHESQMRMTVDDMRGGIEASGRGTELLPLLDRDHYRPSVDLFVREWARRVGEPAGLEAAEAFRHETAGLPW